MIFSLPAIATGLATAIALFIKHPIITKMLIFTTFIGLITYSISFMRDLVLPHIANNSLLALSAYFGILDGISLMITIIISGFGMKQILRFISST